MRRHIYQKSKTMQLFVASALNCHTVCVRARVLVCLFVCARARQATEHLCEKNEGVCRMKRCMCGAFLHQFLFCYPVLLLLFMRHVDINKPQWEKEEQCSETKWNNAYLRAIAKWMNFVTHVSLNLICLLCGC